MYVHKNARCTQTESNDKCEMFFCETNARFETKIQTPL